MNSAHRRLMLLVGVGLSCVAIGSAEAAGEAGAPVLSVPTLGLDLSRLQPEPAAAPKETSPRAAAADAAAPKKSSSFGIAGSNWFSAGLGYMHDFEEDQAGELHLGVSHFIADEVEFSVELTGWYFDQTGENTGGVNPGFNFRWHFLHDASYDWTIFGEAGIGLLFAFDEVPDGGTGFNFTPRAGVGFTTRIDDSGDRLQIGLRWQHISNGRIEGDGRNPGRDSLMGYVGIMFPF